MGTGAGRRAAPDVTRPEDGFLLAMFALSRQMRARVPGDPIDAGAFQVLHTVACHGPARPSEVADRLRLDASTISRHLRNLERAGLVDRAGDPDDRRAARVGVSTAGQDVLDEGFRVRRELVSAAFAGWPEQDRQALVALLARLAEDMSSIGSDKEGK
jgi:DNA-binding MarR family transcriptional regulator